MLDLKITDARIIDGTGTEAYLGDVGIAFGVITEVGRVTTRARQEINADGASLIPGLVDIHTHYDGQVDWDPMLAPSSWHGATTVVMGNCGVGFAPVRPHQRDMLIELMEGVEDIPHPVLAKGLSWEWETFGQYLDAVDAKPHAIDFATYLPHGPLRVYVMSERGARREAATADDLALMQREAEAAFRAGALGFATSRTILHKTSAGEPTPMLDAAEVELSAIGAVMRARQSGVWQLVSDFTDLDAEFGMLRRLTLTSGRGMTFTISQRPDRPGDWRRLLSLLDKAAADGLPMLGQVIGRPIGVLQSLQTSTHPFFANPAYRSIATLPHAERLAKLRDPRIREEILAVTDRPDQDVLRRYPAYIGYLAANPGFLYRLGDPPRYLPALDESAGAIALREGRSPFEVVYDWLLEADGHGLLYLTLTNWVEGHDGPLREMLLHPHTVVGLADGGAHFGMICDASASTFMFTHWARDAAPERRIALERVVHWQTQRTAQVVGLHDRGVIAPGYRADLNLVDFNGLSLPPPRVVQDLPAGGSRLLQGVQGFLATIVAGEPILIEGHATGALPGRLVRGTQSAPPGDERRARPKGNGLLP